MSEQVFYMTGNLVFELVLGMVALDLCMSQDQWHYTFVLENHNIVSGSRVF